MKKIFHDIIPPEKRSIRNIPLSKKESSFTDEEKVNARPLSPVQPSTYAPASPIVEKKSISQSMTHVSRTMDGIRPARMTTRSVENAQNDVKIEKETVYTEYTETPTSAKYTVEPMFMYGTDQESQVKAEKEEESDDNLEEDDLQFEEWNSKNKSTYKRPIIALLILFTLSFFLLSNFFSSTTIVINPVRHDVVLSATKIDLSEIAHERVTTTLSATEEISVKGTLKVERKATGKIVLYNAYNSAVQKLVAGTRLETPNGLIYKLTKEVSIPAQKTVAGKKVPGNIEAEVEAEMSGEKYNQGLRDFKIVAYKNSDRYEAIYGRSKTQLANGFSGTVPNVSSSDTAAAISNIKEKIKNDAYAYFAKVATQKGSSFIYSTNTISILYNESEQKLSKDEKKSVISVTAEVKGFVLDSKSIFEQILRKQNAQTFNEDINNLGTSSNDITYTGDSSKLKIELKGESELTITGTTSISSSIDYTKVSKAVSGLSKEQAIGAIKGLVELETIEIRIKPWWNKKLSESDRIHIEIEE